ncbi:MAG: hypothetical protein C4524_08835 [Candidatus Zixiibacteriota bacterium]|nr:MAG: hypothetical protein C4524_08835 [candidate division Zixibacteria bacterium]
MGNDLLDRLESLAEGGALMHGERRFLLVTPEVWVELQRAAEAETGADRVGQTLYHAARRWGLELTGEFQQDLDLPREDLVRHAAVFARQLGWGRVEITSLETGRGSLELEVFHSAFAEAYAKAGHPVCHLIRGLFAGVWQALLGAEVEGLEARCRAVDGPGPCMFMFAATGARRQFGITVTAGNE